MDLVALRIFKEVAESGGITRAARRLHRVQSSVTTRVQQLEQRLGAQLFERSGRGLHLTPQGRVLLGYAERLLDLSQEAESALMAGPPRGLLRLGALESSTASRLPPLFVAFHRELPDVRVELITGTNDALLAALLERRIEAAFMAEAPAHAELSHQPLFAEKLVVITTLDHAPVRRAGDVAGDSVIAFPQGCAYRRVLERWLGAETLASVRVMELGSYHAIVACVAAGAGIAVMPESVLDTVGVGHVARHTLPQVLARRITPLVWRTAQQSPALVHLRKLARQLTRR